MKDPYDLGSVKGSLRLDLGPVSGREHLYAGQMEPNAGRPNDAPTHDEHPRGWTAQHIARQAPPVVLRCILCWALGDHVCAVAAVTGSG